MITINKSHWLASVPATFMTAVCVTYILMAPEGFNISHTIAYPIGIAAAIFGLVSLLRAAKKSRFQTAAT